MSLNLVSGWSRVAALCTCTVLATMVYTERASAMNVAVEISLVVDVSGSVDDTEYGLMRDGHAAAFSNPQVLGLIATAPGGIAVNVIQFSTSATEVISWTHLDSVADALAFSTTLSNMTRDGGIGSLTNIAGGVSLANSSIGGNGFDAAHSVIDLVGDGTQNWLGSVTAERDNALATNTDAINGLAILNEEPNLDDYYATNLIGGTLGDGSPAFVAAAADFQAFEDAVTGKLQIELIIPEPSVALLGFLGAMGMFLRVSRRRPVA